jgi:type II secretory pathway component PulF
MMKTHVLIASFCALLAGLCLVGVAYLSFVFPKKVALWADEGRDLSSADQLLANLSSLCTSNGVVLLPVLLLVVVGCVVWSVKAGKATV